jgi:ribonuclease Z
MLTTLKAGRHRIRGASLGGMYTALHVPELNALFDAGVALRSAVSARRLFLSHAHGDHVGALPGFLAMRGLAGVRGPLEVVLPEGIEGDLQESLAALSRLHRWPLEITPRPLAPGAELDLGGGRFVRAFKTFHPVPSLGYVFGERVEKLRSAWRTAPGEIIRARRDAGHTDLFDTHERLRFAYATDTLPEVLDHTPDLASVETLVLECTFLDARKSLAAARAGCHIHLDELLPRLARLRVKELVLMHFSQVYKPPEVVEILRARLPAELPFSVLPFVPDTPHWWN